MSYYITAHKYNNKINIPIEEKHKYKTDSVIPVSNSEMNEYQGYTWWGTTIQTNSLSLRRRNISDLVDATSHSKQPESSGSFEYSLALKNPQLFYVPRLFSLEQGTGPDQRIGEKIFMKTVKIMLDIKLNEKFFYGMNGNVAVINEIETYKPTTIDTRPLPTTPSAITEWDVITTTKTNTIDTYQNNRLHYSQWAKFRIVIIRFDDFDWPAHGPYAALETYFADLFNGVHVPNFIVPALNNSPYAPLYAISNQSQMLRESTEYTGKYQKLYDEVITLGDKDPAKHIEINLNPKMNLTFGSDGYITNEKWNNVYGFILPPTLYSMDMDPISFKELNKSGASTSSDINIADFTTNIKFTYYDI